MFFIGQNINHVHMTNSFLELLIFFWITQVDIYSLKFISYHITEIFYLDTDQTPKETNHEIKRSIFTCFFHEIKTNIFTCFFNIKLKFLVNKFYFFSVIIIWFHEHIFRSSHSQMFFKIAALKDFTIFWIKKGLQQQFFSVNIANFLTTVFL